MTADRAVAIEVLVEGGLERFQRIAVARNVRRDAGDVVAVAVGAPHRVLTGARHLPGDVVAACRLVRADRRPAAELDRP